MSNSILVNNILSVYYAASTAELVEGKAWYRTANQIAQQLSEKYGVSVIQAAAVIAILSPQKLWTRNVVEAEKVLDLYFRTQDAHTAAQVPGLFCQKSQRAKIENILNEADPEAIIISHKVYNFYRLIAYQDLNAVCVDGHAVNIANNGTVRVGITAAATKLRTKAYTAYDDAYREAGRIVGISGSDMQAITWVTYRNIPC